MVRNRCERGGLIADGQGAISGFAQRQGRIGPARQSWPAACRPAVLARRVRRGRGGNCRIPVLATGKDRVDDGIRVAGLDGGRNRHPDRPGGGPVGPERATRCRCATHSANVGMRPDCRDRPDRVEMPTGFQTAEPRRRERWGGIRTVGPRWRKQATPKRPSTGVAVR